MSIGNTEENSDSERSNKAKESSGKTFLGGYINKSTGKVYHHAVAQTLPTPWKHTFITRYSRETQTKDLEDKSQQTPKDASTQLPIETESLSRPEEDKILSPTKDIKSVDDTGEDYLNKIITLQKYIKRWLAQQEMIRRKKLIASKGLEVKETLNQEAQGNDEWLQEMEERKENPKSDSDFLLLFSDLQKWWEFQAKCISDVRSGADLQAAMWMLVNIETKEISKINELRNVVELQKIIEERDKYLGMAAKSKLWKVQEGRIEVETNSTQRANSLHDLYTILSKKNLPAQDRVDVLTRLKEILKPYHSQLTNNLKRLADREIDLLLRGIKLTNLEGLQARIRDLFWQFCKRPMFNPEMQAMTKVQKYNETKPHVLSCASCKCFYTLEKSSTNEALGKSVLESFFGKCTKCRNLEREAWMRKDLELYKRMLKLLRIEEEKMDTTSTIIYSMQPKDIGYLMETIWKHQSCISGERNDMDLQFMRYDMDKSWTPWNCLLVTKKEASAISSTTNPKKSFDESFRVQVSQKHAEAKQYFSTIPRFIPYLTRKPNEKDDVTSSNETVL